MANFLTSFLGLKLLQPGQNQKEVNVNDSLIAIDAAAGMFTVKLHGGGTSMAVGNTKEVFIVPFGPNGETLKYKVYRVTSRVETAGLTATVINPQRSTGTGALSGANLLSTPLTIAIAGFEAVSTSVNNVVIQSGDKLFLNITAIGTNADRLNVWAYLSRTP